MDGLDAEISEMICLLAVCRNIFPTLVRNAIVQPKWNKTLVRNQNKLTPLNNENRSFTYVCEWLIAQQEATKQNQPEIFLN